MPMPPAIIFAAIFSPFSLLPLFHTPIFHLPLPPAAARCVRVQQRGCAMAMRDMRARCARVHALRRRAIDAHNDANHATPIHHRRRPLPLSIVQPDVLWHCLEYVHQHGEGSLIVYPFFPRAAGATTSPSANTRPP
jgi:hypothetical protein